MRKILLAIVITPFLTVSLAQNNTFRIDGLARKFSDNTVLYLEYTMDDKKQVDSALVINEKFTFSGELYFKGVKAILRTKKFSDYKFIWLENAVISFRRERKI